MNRRKFWRIVSLFLGMFLLIQGLPGCTTTPPPSTAITPDPTHQYAFQGWGTSLAWWAETVGQWQGTPRNNLEETLFGTKELQELGLNIVRYNFGANGPVNSCPKGSFRQGGNINSYEPSPGQWDWSADPAQLQVLKDTSTLLGDSAIFESFANSAPAWMLRNYCTQGDCMQVGCQPDGQGECAKDNTACRQNECAQGDKGPDNLCKEYEQAYASYLATIVQHFHDSYNIPFRTVEPFNEPDEPWSMLFNGHSRWGGNQEGMYVDIPQQERVIEYLHQLLPAYTSISSPDDNNISNAVDTYHAYAAAGLSGSISQLNTHSYNGSDDNRNAFYQIGLQQDRKGKPAWMSEYTTNGTDKLGPKCVDQNISHNDSMIGALQLSCQILHDINIMHPTAWSYWQAVENKPSNFGLLTIPSSLSNESFDKTKQYFALWQYSHFIRPHYQIIDSGSLDDSLAAYDLSSHTLVIITTNQESANKTVTYNLSHFSAAPSAVTAYTTSEETSSTHPPNEVSLPFKGKQFSALLKGQSINTFVIHLGVPAPSPTPQPTKPLPVPNTFTVTGAISGTLITSSLDRCGLYLNGFDYELFLTGTLNNHTTRFGVFIRYHGPGTYIDRPSSQVIGGGLELDHGAQIWKVNGVQEIGSGSATIDSGGRSGSFSSLTFPGTGATAGTQVHISGNWRCT